MKPPLDKNFQKNRTFFRAEAYVNGLKTLERINEMADIEQFKDSLELSVDHPYFYRARDLHVLEIVDNCVDLLRTILARDPAPKPSTTDSQSPAQPGNHL